MLHHPAAFVLVPAGTYNASFNSIEVDGQFGNFAEAMFAMNITTLGASQTITLVLQAWNLATETWVNIHSIIAGHATTGLVLFTIAKNKTALSLVTDAQEVQGFLPRKWRVAVTLFNVADAEFSIGVQPIGG